MIIVPQNLHIAYRLGYSKKGWIDGELGVEWIKHFDLYTKARANGRPRLLLLDGHNSHYTLDFLQYARKENIIILCYLSHSTHVYQGLDVVVFAILKCLFIEERNKYEAETQLAVTKDTFLGVLGRAYVKAVTPPTVKSAFCKTGVWPFNPSAISDTQLKPSIDTSSQGSRLPLPQSTSLCTMASMFHAFALRSRPVSEVPSHDKTETADPPIDPALLIQTVVDQLVDSSARFLVSGNKIQATDQLHLDVAQINPNPHYYPEPIILDTLPRTELEKKLYKAYQEELMHGAYQERVIVGYRSVLVLQNVYCEKVHH